MARANLNRTRRRRERRRAVTTKPLRQTIHVLDGAYAACVTAQMALHHQNAEQDSEIALSLRLHVSDPVSRAAEALRAYVDPDDPLHSEDAL